MRDLASPIERNLALPGHPFALAELAGSLWVGLGKEGVVLRIDPDSGVILNSVELPAPPSSLTSVDDALWVVAGNNMESDVWKLVTR